MPMLPAQVVLAAPATQTVAQMRDHRRGLLIVAPAADDPQLRAQHQALVGWRQGAADRDVSLVELVGRVVSGATDDAALIRARYRLLPNAFAVVLIGKDGHEAYRSTKPVTAEQLQGTIDAMPMRRSGQR